MPTSVTQTDDAEAPAAWTELWQRVPRNLPPDPTELLRPETLKFVRNLASTTAVLEYPINLTPAEAKVILELLETRSTMLRAWVETLEWGMHCARIAQRLVEQAGFPRYATWIEQHRVRPMQTIIEKLLHPQP